MRRLLRSYLFALQLAAVLGLALGLAGYASVVEPPLLGAALGALSGSVEAALIMAVVGGIDIFLPRTRVGRMLDRSPFLVATGSKVIVYGSLVGLIVGSRLAQQLACMTLVGDSGQACIEQLRAKLPTPLLIVIACAVVGFMTLARQLANLVGDERLFRDLALGRYHRPRVEERFFLFVDVVGSTALAERLGPASVHEFLDRVFRIASDAVDDFAGEIYQYVGDEIVITWTLQDGQPDARPIACHFAVQTALDLEAGAFERRFGAAPRLRAALHAGTVITGEVGGSRRAIVFHGDVMNTTSRIENATRELGHCFLVSVDALDRLPGTQSYTVLDLGPQQLRGRTAAVRLYAVEPAR